MNNFAGYKDGRGQCHAMGLSAALAMLAVAFGLSGQLLGQTVAESKDAEREAAVSKATRVALATEPERGHTLFERNCAHCHGDDARGDEGPNLHKLKKSDARIATVIKEGIKGEMPAFRKKFNKADVQALVSYLRSLTD